MKRYTIGLDYGTNSVRALVADTETGAEAGSAVHGYAHGREGVLTSPDDPNLARQHPGDYLPAGLAVIRAALAQAARAVKGFTPAQVVGLGVDTTGSTPIPVDPDGLPLALQPRFAQDPAAMAWLWKDHTAADEAEEITALARREHPEYLARCGGVYSSEWYFSKVLHCRRTRPAVFRAAHAWVEMADWIPAMLTGTQAPGRLRIGICAAGHKAMFDPARGGYPAADFLAKLHPDLGELRRRMPGEAHDISEAAGRLTTAWARRSGLPAGIPVAIGAFDAHLGAVGAGVAEGVLVKTIGTSTCDLLVAPADRPVPDIPGICGIVRGSILPGWYGLEAGQSAVGDLFNWFVNVVRPLGADGGHAALTRDAAKSAPGASGLLALDWNNGNRTVLADPRLSGLLVGQTLHTTPAEIYRALIEATAFGALTIVRRFEEYGVRVRSVVNCGGIAEKNPLVMQIYADVLGRPMKVSRSAQTCALGAAIAAAVVAGVHRSFPAAQRAMTGTKPGVFRPRPAARRVYAELYEIYRELHDAFGAGGTNAGTLSTVMKRLIAIRARARGLGAR